MSSNGRRRWRRKVRAIRQSAVARAQSASLYAEVPGHALRYFRRDRRAI